MLICFKLRQSHIRRKDLYYENILPPTSAIEIFCSEEDIFLMHPYAVIPLESVVEYRSIATAD